MMRTIRRIVRGDDMPLYGTVTRVKRGLYEVVIKFTQSKRVLHVERIGAPNVTAVKLFFKREYPTLTWGKPKFPKPPKARKPPKPRYSHVAKTPKRNPKGKKP
jgi:hypothetical protein